MLGQEGHHIMSAAKPRHDSCQFLTIAHAHVPFPGRYRLALRRACQAHAQPRV
jgi:hypothetical protein